MRFSNHTVVLDHYPSANEYLLYNTRTQGMVKINRELRQAIDKFDESASLIKEENVLNVKKLHQMGILTESEEEDDEHLRDFFRQLKYCADDKVFAVTLLTTYTCNLKCVYCFEESSRDNVKMTFDTAEHSLNWLKQKVECFGYKKIYITFYGGEPLTNKPVLEHIAENMQEWCARRGVQFQFMLQTNGYLMTPDCIERYLKIGLGQVRVSVDGDADVHDRNRPLRGGGGTYKRIMENIVASVDKVKIGISTSYEKGEIGHIERMLDYLENLGILHKLGRFIFSPIHPTLGPENDFANVKNSECMRNYEDTQLAETNTKIHNLMKKKNLFTKSGLAISACSLTRENGGVTVDQHGKIYKCNSMLGHSELAIGDVREEKFNTKQKEFRDLDVWQQCPQDCIYLPMCSGGCRLMSFLEVKNFKTPGCKKLYLDKMIPSLIKKEYEALLLKKN